MFDSLFVDPSVAGANKSVLPDNLDPQTTDRLIRMAKFIIGKAKWRIDTSARIFNKTYGDYLTKRNGTDLTKAILEYIGEAQICPT